RAGADEVAYDAAVLDLAEGRVDAAIAALEKLSARLPDALVQLGIGHEKKGEPQQALDAWRRARKAGARSAPLAEWIEAKERIYGGAPWGGRGSRRRWRWPWSRARRRRRAPTPSPSACSRRA